MGECGGRASGADPSETMTGSRGVANERIRGMTIFAQQLYLAAPISGWSATPLEWSKPFALATQDSLPVPSSVLGPRGAWRWHLSINGTLARCTGRCIITFGSDGIVSNGRYLFVSLGVICTFPKSHAV